MAINDIVQTIAEARVDARSLSEFVFKPAGFKVARRLAPTIDTLQFYINRFNALDGDFRSSVSTAVSSLNNSVAEAEGKVAYIETTVQDAINNTAVEGGVLADTFVTATANGLGTIARTQRDKNSESVSIKDFGAKGDGDETLITVPSYTSDYDNGITFTQQTHDGDAINKAIRYLRTKGGGSLHIPKGDYRIYGYLERIDFSCVIYGDGTTSLLKNCVSSPTDVNGYGIFCVAPQNYEEVSLLNFQVDGNASARIKPTLEHRSYPLCIYGKPKVNMYGITSVDSPIDCFMTAYVDDDSNTYVKAVNCNFDNSFRNTMSLVAGWNQDYVNCTITRGGYVHGGTQPRYCLDIEPNLVGRSIEGIKFTSCTFREAINTLVGGIWGTAQFNNCVLDGSNPHPIKLMDKTYPWIFQLTEGQWEMNGCKFIGRSDYMQNASHHYNSFNTTSKFNDEQYFRISNSNWLNCGFVSTSRSIDIRNCSGQNSLHPFLFVGGTTTDNAEVYIRNLRLVNVFDGINAGEGTVASFAIADSVGGNIDIDDVSINIDTDLLQKMNPLNFTTSKYYGFYISPAKSITNNKKVMVSKVYTGGFYKRLPAFLGKAENAGTYRDWGSPNLPPINTGEPASVVSASLVDGAVANNTVTNKAVTGTAITKDASADRTLGGRTAAYYRDCTMWGNYA